MNQATLVGQHAVASDESVSGNRLSENLHTQHVGDDFLRLPIQVRVHDRNVVVAGNEVSQRRETLINATNHDIIGKRITDVLKLHI